MSNLFCNIDLTDSCEQEVLSIRQPEGKRSDFAAVNNTTAGQPCSDEDPSESNQCCICSERWDSSGSRRVVALKRCGHLFCLECISEWLRVQKPTSCPVCRQRTCKREIVKLVVPKLPLAGEDKEQLTQLQGERDRLHAELMCLKRKCEQLEAQQQSLARSPEHSASQRHIASSSHAHAQRFLGWNMVGAGDGVRWGMSSPVARQHAVLAAAAQGSSATNLHAPMGSQTTALALDACQHCLYVAHGKGGATHLTKISLVSMGSTVTIPLNAGVCNCIAVQPEHYNSGLIAIASHLGLTFVQGQHNHVVESVRCEAGSRCAVVSWRSEHQVWAAHGAHVKLWDIRNLQRSVTEYQPDSTPVHSLCTAREGVVAGTQLGAYGMAFLPDGVVLPLSSRQPASSWQSRCTSVSVANNDTLSSSLVVCTFEMQPTSAVCDHLAPVSVAHHLVSMLTGVGSTCGRTWKVTDQFLSYVDSALSDKACAVNLTGDADNAAFLCVDGVTGSLQLWDIGQVNPKRPPLRATPLLFLGDGRQQDLVQNMTASMMSQDRLGVALVRATCAQSPAGIWYLSSPLSSAGDRDIAPQLPCP